MKLLDNIGFSKSIYRFFFPWDSKFPWENSPVCSLRERIFPTPWEPNWERAVSPVWEYSPFINPPVSVSLVVSSSTWYLLSLDSVYWAQYLQGVHCKPLSGMKISSFFLRRLVGRDMSGSVLSDPLALSERFGMCHSWISLGPCR